MHKKIAITHLEVIHALATSANAFWQAVKEKAPLKQPKIEDSLNLDLLLEDHVRRMDRTAHLLALCVKKMLCQDNQQIDVPVEQFGICASTNFSGFDSILAFITRVFKSGPARANPNEYPNTAFNTCNGYASIENCLKGYNNTVAGFGSLGEAYDVLQLGRAQSMVASGVEAYGQYQEELFSALTKNLWLSEGTAALLLTLTPSTKPLAWYLGYQTTYDAREFNHCELNGIYLAKTITALLEKSGLTTNDINGIILSTAQLDITNQRQILALKQVFKERIDSLPVYHLETICGYSGATAECLAAAYACQLLNQDEQFQDIERKRNECTLLVIVMDQFGINVAHLFQKA
jgi:3-oxoacyl-(acyl-carrier-protein) synthase